MIFWGIAFAESGDPRYIEELDDVMHTLPPPKKETTFLLAKFLGFLFSESKCSIDISSLNTTFFAVEKDWRVLFSCPKYTETMKFEHNS